MNKFVMAVLTGAALWTGSSCHRNPITGRSQLTLVSEKQVQTLALTEYQKFLNSNKVVPATNADGEMVKRVGRRIADAIGQGDQFWQRMAALGGQKPPTLLSDHPADSSRIQKLQELMPEALTYYKPDTLIIGLTR